MIWYGATSHTWKPYSRSGGTALVRYLIECDGQYADGGGALPRTPFAYAVDSWQTPDWI